MHGVHELKISNLNVYCELLLASLAAPTRMLSSSSDARGKMVHPIAKSGISPQSKQDPGAIAKDQVQIDNHAVLAIRCARLEAQTES